MLQPGSRAEPMFLQSLCEMGFPQVRAEKALILTHNCGLEPAINWMMEHAGDADIDALLALPPAAAPPPAAAAAATAALQLGDQYTQSSQPVVGVPTDASLVVHPDGRAAPAHVVGVQGETKVVLVVARELGMSPGKVGAQCAHAAVGLYKRLRARRAPWLHAWEDSGEKTVVLAVDTCEQLAALAEHAEAAQLATCAVHDAGRTEVAAGSLTVLGLGGFSENVDVITGHLQTL